MNQNACCNQQQLYLLQIVWNLYLIDNFTGATERRCVTFAYELINVGVNAVEIIIGCVVP